MNGAAPRLDVAVIGAGIAGLVAAQTLVQSGRTVRCFEARDRVGGRAHTVESGGLAIDLGATWYWHNEPLVASLLDQLGLGSFSQDISGDALYEAPGSPVQRVDGNPVDAPALRFGGGAQALPDALAALLPNEALSLADPVDAIECDGEGVVIVARSGRVRVNQVIVALPPALAAARLRFTPELPPAVRDAASGTPIWMGETIKAVAVYDEPFWRAAGLAGSAISYRGPFREFHDHSGPDAGLGAIFAFSHGGLLPSADDRAIAGVFVDQLTRMFGDAARNPRAIHVANWALEPFTTPAGVPLTPARGGFGHPALQDPVHGRIHWASTETATAYGGHVEGAIRAGIQAAEQIVKR